MDRALWVHTADLAGDGDLDLLSASSIDDKIAWHLEPTDTDASPGAHSAHNERPQRKECHMRNPTPDRFFSGLSGRRITLVLVLPFALALSPSARATDGIAEINHICAVQTGCFAGDFAGYPITIGGQAGRSYRLTSDLIVPDENTDGIVVGTSDVGIDLNNFAIIRSGCEGATTNCTPASGTGSGVERTSSDHRGISVANGSFTGMGRYGIIVGDQAEVRGMRVRWNRLDGIYANFGSTVSGNTARKNGDDGIFANPGSTVSENTAYGNDGDGIQVNNGCTVRGNTVRNNGGYGLNLGGQSAYRENVITLNTTGTVLGASAVNMLSNSCNGATTCP